MAEEQGESEDDIDYTDEDVANLLEEALKIKIKESPRLKNKTKLVGALKDTLDQFLSCYRIMGYDLEGNPLVMIVSNNGMEYSALNNQFIEEFQRFFGERESDGIQDEI